MDALFHFHQAFIADPLAQKISRITSITTMDLNSVDSFAGALHYRFWSDPQIDASEGRVLSKSRQQMVWTVMHVALRLETTSTSPDFADVLPSEMWMLIMTFVKHEQPPM